MIILEGFDNSGKSTLSKQFDLEVKHPGPAPQSYVEELDCLRKQLCLASQHIVHDRVTCISSQVYDGRLNDPWLSSWLNAMINVPKCVLVYCRPPLDVILDFSNHEVKEYDSPGHLEKIRRNAYEMVMRYDALINNVPHIKFDWTNPQVSLSEIKNISADFELWYLYRNP